jgi:colicin import membrane protein
VKQYLISRFQKAPVQFCFACLAIACHLFFFAHLLISKKDARKTREHRIIVNTKNNTPPAKPRPQVQTAAQKPVKPLKAPQTTKTAQAPQKPASSPVTPKAKPQPVAQPAKKTPTPKGRSKPNKAQEGDAIPAELVKQLQESIAKIEKKPDKYHSAQKFVLPEKPTPFADIDSSSSSSENRHDFLTGVKEEVIQQLHLALHLPDFGEVKVQLSLSENGSVQTVKVLKSASQRNREYLEKELPRLSFACMALHKLSAKERTFIISFHNEM